MQAAFSSVSAEDSVGWFQHAGYIHRMKLLLNFFLSCACTLLLYVYNVSPVSMSLSTVHASDVVKCK